MIVCLCNALSESHIRQQIAAGARSAAKVYLGCGAAPQCGKCVGNVRQMLSEAQASAGEAAAAVPAE